MSILRKALLIGALLSAAALGGCTNSDRAGLNLAPQWVMK